MSVLIDQLTNGVIFGFVVVLLALGFTIVIGTTHIINFAQGEVYMVGAFIGAWCMTIIPNVFVALGVAIVACAALNAGIYQLIFRRIRHLTMIRTLLAGLGSALIIRSVWGEFFGVETRGFPQIEWAEGAWRLGGVTIPYQSVALVAVTLVLLGIAYWLIFRTTFGLKLRALAANADGANGIGMNVPRIQTQAFALAGGLSGAAGVLTAWFFGSYQFTMGATGIALAFVAAVAGGLGSIGGALLGGIAVGLVRAIGGAIDSNYIEAYPFLFLVLLLLVRPTGFFGRKMELR